ncbi:MAG: YihY/virulence factor BrkB family protein [Clostridiales bacterium]|nr:YihY/virulence factor BrkB family protein [Candidatus Blautia equi]
MKEKMRSLVGLGKEFAGGMGKRRLTVYATSGCYYLFMSLVPIVMILCCILPYTPFNLNMILNYIEEYFAESLGDILRNIATAVYSSNGATLTVSIVLTLYSASASMKALMKGMDSAYECENQDNFIVFSLKALGYMVVLIVTILLSLVIMVYGGRILFYLQRYMPNIGPLKMLLSKGRYFLVLVVLTIIFMVLYNLMPAKKVKFKDQIPGAVFAALTWVIFSSVFTVYITVSNKFGAYGFIGTIMVAMMWMYYCLFFLLIGGFMNSFLSERKAEQEGMLLLSTEAGDLSVEEFDRSLPSEDLGFAAGDAYDSLDRALEEMDEEEEPEGDGSEEAPKPKKKLPIPMLAGAVACAIAAIVGAFFFIRGKKKKAKAAANKGLPEKIVEKLPDKLVQNLPEKIAEKLPETKPEKPAKKIDPEKVKALAGKVKDITGKIPKDKVGDAMKVVKKVVATVQEKKNQ